MPRISPARPTIRRTAPHRPWRLSASVLAVTMALTAAPLAAAPGIADLYQKALQNDTLLHAAIARRKAVSLSPGVARAQLLPQLSLQASRRRFAEQEVRGVIFTGANQENGATRESSSDYVYDVDQLSLTLTQTLFNLGDYIVFKQSKSEDERAGLELEAARQDLILRLAEAYFDVLSAKETLKFARSEQEAVSRQLEQARERFEVGLVPITDVKEAEAAYDLAEAEEISADNQLHNARHALSVITDHDAPALRPLAANIPTPSPAPKNMQAWVDRALAQNLDLLAQQITTNIAEQEIKLQRAGHYPSVDLFASRNENDTRSGSPAPRETKEFVVGVELNMPIFAGRGTLHRTRRAAQFHRESLEQLKGTQRETKRAAREAYLNVIASVSRVAALKRAEESARTALESNEAGFQVGTRTSVDVLLALKELFRTRRDYADVRYDYLLNTLRLKKATGMLSKRDLTRINNYLREAPS